MHGQQNIKKQYTLPKFVSNFLLLPYRLSDVRSKGCASRVDRYSSVVIVKLDALSVSPKSDIAHGCCEAPARLLLMQNGLTVRRRYVSRRLITKTGHFLLRSDHSEKKSSHSNGRHQLVIR